ncbi:MAG TPA: DUF2268 domain-containing putative Zn-dependent protease [Longimicrobiaceae bacterium]|nr:DUF2268 domain-containing putative Zn-dependent protease [Longimicrobiaceae bacterium]
MTDDIPRFWAVFDRATPETLPELLQREYLDPGTAGLQDFIPHRIRSAAELAEAIVRRRERYEEIREASLSVRSSERAIRAPFYALEYLYPAAVFPDIYFVIGRLSAGGTASGRGLLVGTEMFRDAEGLRSIVSHELIHFQQKASGQYAAAEAAPTLLAVAVLEGSADFIAELISGVRGNAQAQAYGRVHECEIWRDFQQQMHGKDLGGWFYGDPPGERPADLGYFVGYRIVEAYYIHAADKRRALYDILTIRNFDDLLSRSGYQP